DVWEYNYFSDSWQQKNNFQGAERAYAFVYTIDNRAYVGNGYNGEYLSDFYGYIPPVLGLNKNQEKDVNAYPNPSNQYFVIEMDEIKHFKLFSIDGKEFTQNVSFKNENNKIIVD